MGAQSFVQEAVGYSAKECFDELVADAQYEYGNDIYNGTISTCDLRGCKTIATVYSKEAEKKAQEYIKKDGNGSKWTATALCLGVVGYDVVTVKKVAPPASAKKAKFAMKYVVKDTYDGQHVGGKVFETKTEADKYAVYLATAHPDKGYSVVKCPVNIVPGSSDVVTKLETTVKRVKAKPKKATVSVKPVYKYIFYGWAAC